MRTHKECAKLIIAVVVVLVVYGSSIVPCISETSDNVVISKSGWNQLQSAINNVFDAIRTIGSSTTPASPSPPVSASTLAPAPTSAQLALAAELPEHEHGPVTPTSQVYLEGKWKTEWPRAIVTIKLARVADPMYFKDELRLRPESDGTYDIIDEDHYRRCHYNIALSPDRKKMVWMPIQREERSVRVTDGDAAPVEKEKERDCRPATFFYRIGECCGERDKDCCVERHKDCCVERHKDCCVERRREHVVWRRYPLPCYCRWEEFDEY